MGEQAAEQQRRRGDLANHGHPEARVEAVAHNTDADREQPLLAVERPVQGRGGTVVVDGEPVALRPGITADEAGARLEEAGLTGEEARAVGAALVEAASGFADTVDTVNVVVMVRPGPQSLWRRLCLLVLRWVLFLHIMLICNLAISIAEPVGTFARCVDFGWNGGAVPWGGTDIPFGLYPGVVQWTDHAQIYRAGSTVGPGDSQTRPTDALACGEDTKSNLTGAGAGAGAGGEALP